MSADTLNILSARAIQEFEEVQQKYKEYYEKYQQEEANRRRLEAQFKQLKQVSLLAVAEYESLHKQYLTENQYRQHIEERLRKVSEENQEIRKQHKLGANTTIVSQSNGNNGNVQETKGELEVLRAMKDAINNELREAKKEVTKVKEELLAEQQAHAVTKNQLELGVKQMKQLNRVSVLAFTEFNDLKKKLEVEETNRKTAEEVAAEMLQQQQQDERKFSIIKQTAQKDDQVKKFLEEIDELNVQINKLKHESQEKIDELEDELTSLKDSTQTKELEEKVNLLMEQLDISQKQVVEADARATKIENDSRVLYVRLAEAERKVGENKPSLPPPPPPPPPPIAAPVIRKFITKIGKGRKKGLLAEKEEDPRIEAMTQMIDRIKKGVKLRSIASPAKVDGVGEGKEEEGAMGELAGLLSNMRRGRRGTEDSLNVIEEKSEPEFARVKLKKTGSIHSPFSVEEPANTELKQKLERQKSLADGINEILEEVETKHPTRTSSTSNKEKKDEEKEKEEELTKKSEENNAVSDKAESETNIEDEKNKTLEIEKPEEKVEENEKTE